MLAKPRQVNLACSSKQHLPRESYSVVPGKQLLFCKRARGAVSGSSQQA